MDVSCHMSGKNRIPVGTGSSKEFVHCLSMIKNGVLNFLFIDKVINLQKYKSIDQVIKNT